MHPLIYRPLRVSALYGQPAQEPVGLEVMKAHDVVDFPDDDALISGFIATARDMAEQMTDRALITRTLAYKIDRFPQFTDQLLEVPGGTLQAVSSITYNDINGDEQTWNAANYIVDTTHEPGRIGLAFNAEWPSIREWDLPITINATVGYGDNPGDVPEGIRNAIRLMAAELFAHRKDSVAAQLGTMSLSSQHLVSPHRMVRI